MSSTHSQQTKSKVPRPFDEEDEYPDAEKNFKLKSPRFWIIILGMYMAVFLVALDRLIIATAIPAITNEFNSVGDIGWYGSAYMLTAAIFNPLFGRIYQLYATKWVYLISIIVFEVGSAVCGAAPSSAAFIVGRAIAGIGAAGIFCGGIMIIVPLVPLRRRPIFTAFFGIAFGVSSVLGPLIGGTFTDNRNLTWRWCFYINLPIGAFTFVAILLLFHLESLPREKFTILEQFKQVDPLGLLFFVPSMVCLIIALQWGGSTYAWSAPRLIGLLVTFAVLLIAFIVVEVLKPDTAMIPMRVVLNRSVGGSMIFVFLLSGGMMIVIYYLTIWFQAVQDQSAKEAGIRTIPVLMALIVMGIIGAIFTQRIGYYVPAMLLSVCLCAIGGGLLSTLRPNASKGQWIGYQILYGSGIGFGFQTSQLAPQNVLPRADVPLGIAMMFFMQQIGGAIFLSVGQNIFSSKLVASLSDISGLDTKVIIDAGATAYRDLVPLNALGAVIDAYSYALTSVFLITAALSACMIIGAGMVEWKSIKGKKGHSSKGEKPCDEPVEEGKGQTKESNDQTIGKFIEKAGSKIKNSSD